MRLTSQAWMCPLVSSPKTSHYRWRSCCTAVRSFAGRRDVPNSTQDQGMMGSSSSSPDPFYSIVLALFSSLLVLVVNLYLRWPSQNLLPPFGRRPTPGLVHYHAIMIKSAAYFDAHAGFLAPKGAPDTGPTRQPGTYSRRNFITIEFAGIAALLLCGDQPLRPSVDRFRATCRIDARY